MRSVIILPARLPSSGSEVRIAYFLLIMLQQLTVPVMSAPYSPPVRDERAIKMEVGEYAEWYEGDIRTETDVKEISKRMSAQDSPGSGSDTGLNLTPLLRKSRLWPNGTAPFKFDNNLPSNLIDSFRLAMNWWEQVSCVSFVPATAQHTDYLNLTTSKGCSSFVGRRGGMQEVSIGTLSCREVGNAAHELGHALGFWHEHTRPDRDKYIRIIMENIIPKYRYNFHRSEHNGVPDVGYDFQSIMHYSQNAFHNGRGRTIETVGSIPNCIGKIGQRKMLSFLDAMRMNHLYNCSADIAKLEADGNKCPLDPPTTPPPPPTTSPPPKKKCRKAIKTEETVVINFLDTGPITRIGCPSSCKKYQCHPNKLLAYGRCREELFRIYKVLNTKNKNIKSGDPIALESLFRTSQWFDCRKGNCTVTTCTNAHSTTTAPVNITQRVCIHHRLRIYALTKREGKAVQTTDMVYFKHLEEDKYLNCLGKGCRLITEGNCSGSSSSSSGSSGAALCERQLFSIKKITCRQ